MTEWNKCPGCLETTGGSGDYCPNCGAQLNVRCPQCGLTWRFWQNHHYCPKCGSKVHSAGPAAPDSRLVTSGTNKGKPTS
jgi:predicted amidophosphoribosyltransferase